MSFLESKDKFNAMIAGREKYTQFVSEHLSFNKQTKLYKNDGSKNEQYYKWQFLFALTDSGLFTKDYIGTEIHLPKGNKNSVSLKIDAVIFDDKAWFDHYKSYHKNNNLESCFLKI